MDWICARGTALLKLTDAAVSYDRVGLGPATDPEARIALPELHVLGG